ncbi:ChrR family anti-sigma-E factor [Caenispirillum bisanense]|uniref:Anti-ECFsigma factor, ChrR n=1 Tax=Caenispirillum bisanense TaxID=414052 RepID=A0A286G428_9PROT|nr:ChrR family anti-sigma-E factor [Caenispirillum bisanense]SOD90317.1 anti-ECFsigma factor, ChrR [Caenispirillum bisanense]
MSTIKHHPGDDLLVAYAAGSLDEGLSLMVATHLALCPACRTKVTAAESMGAALVDEMPPEPLAEDALKSILARLDEPEPAPPPPPAPPTQVDETTLRTIPEPLRSYLSGNLDALPWRSLGPAVRSVELPTQGAKARLFRIKPGAALPEHSHNGAEYTLVLAGGFSDEVGSFARGDVACADETLLHQPIADPGEPCLCLAVTDAPLRFTGVVPRLMAPFFGI